MDKRKKVQSKWRLVIILSLFLFITIVTQDIVREIVLFRNDLKTLNVSLNNQMKAELQQEVDFRVAELEILYEDLDNDFENHLYNNINSLVFSVNRTLILSTGMSNVELETDMISTVQDYNNDDTHHSYFLIKSDGTLLYDGELDEIVSINILDSFDDFNRTYIEELITETKSNDFGYSNAHFNNGEFLSVGYMGIELSNDEYIIYTTGDKNEFLLSSLSEYYDNLFDFYSTKEKTVFILGVDGIIHIQRNENLHGQLYTNIEDEAVVNTVGIILETAVDRPVGFITANYYLNLIDGEIGDRLIYFHTIQELGLIVGYSADSLQNDTIIDDFVSSSLTKNLRLLVPIYIIMIIIIALVVRLIILNIKNSEELFKEEEELYHVFSDITSDIILITNSKGDIIFTNKLGHEIIYGNEGLKVVNLDEIMIDEEGYKVLIGKNKNYYIKYSVSQVTYDGEQSDLYVVNDVTEKVNTERKLEAMTLSDDLTGLGNRRLMVKDYTDFILPHITDGNKAFLVMIDLDNFKQANDEYGHSYGDDVLIMIAQIFKDHENENIKIYRVGGDEFSMLAIKHTHNEMLSLMRKLKNKVSTHKYGKKVNLGFSAGITEINIKDNKRRLSDYYERADELLYEAKKAGKDRIKI